MPFPLISLRDDHHRRSPRRAENAIRRHGPLLVIVGRFVPGGRTGSTFAAGLLELRYARFAMADPVAVTLWAIYAALLGYLGGSAFRDSAWKPLAVSLGADALIALGVEVWRRARRRRGRDVLGART